MIIRHLPRFRKDARLLKSFEERESWARSDIEAMQLERLNGLWASATKDTTHYRSLRSEHDLPDHFESLDHFRNTVPVLNKQLVRDNPAAFLSDQAEPGSWHRTGGSTGTPMGVYWSKDSHLEMLRCKYRHDQMFGLDIFDRKVVLWGHGNSFAPGIRGLIAKAIRPFEDRLRNRLRLSAYDMGADDLKRHLRDMVRFQPKSMYGYSSAVYLLAAMAAETDFVCPSLRMITMSAEPAFPHFIKAVESTFQIPALVEYGAVECGIIAHEFPDRKLRVREDVTMVETHSRDDGNYDIVVTVLNNPSFPLLRYRIEDVVDRRLEFPDRGFAVMGNVMGRANDFVRSREGRLVHPHAVKHIMDFAHVRRFHAHQDCQGTLSVQLEAVQGLNDDEVKRMNRKLTELLGGYPSSIQVVDTIPPSSAGKHRWVVSDMDFTNATEAAEPISEISQST